jgi:hypothetical protein
MAVMLHVSPSVTGLESTRLRNLLPQTFISRPEISSKITVFVPKSETFALRAVSSELWQFAITFEGRLARRGYPSSLISIAADDMDFSKDATDEYRLPSSSRNQHRCVPSLFQCSLLISDLQDDATQSGARKR